MSLSDKIEKKMSFHFDEIQKILGKGEKVVVDINLDVLFKIHNNCLLEIREINKYFEQAVKDTLRDIMKLNEVDDVSDYPQVPERTNILVNRKEVLEVIKKYMGEKIIK